MARKVSDIEKQIEQLKAQKQRLIARDSSEKRAAENRQKMIIGGFLLANDPELVKQIVSQLKRPQDRRAFNLGAPLASAEEKPPAGF